MTDLAAISLLIIGLYSIQYIRNSMRLILYINFKIQERRYELPSHNQ